MAAIQEDPELKKQYEEMMQQMQAEMDKDPEAFQERVKAEMAMAEQQAKQFVAHIANLDPEDEDIGDVVKDIRKTGEQGFVKYMNDQALMEKLQKKIMIKGLVDAIRAIDEGDEKLGFLLEELNTNGSKGVEKYLGDEELMQAVMVNSILKDDSALHGAAR
eukprot:gene3163-4006_t